MAPSSRNPTWARDELILALDLYFEHRPDKISKTHPAVVDLSDLLNRLPIHSVRPDEVRFRNPNGVYMKLCNFLRFDSAYQGKGLVRGGRDEEEIWGEFANDRDHLHEIAVAIRAHGKQGQPRMREIEEVEIEEAPEGRVLLRVHKVLERNATLVRTKKTKVAREQGCLKCEVCRFDFRLVYGDLGDGFIECHHGVPLSQLRPNQTTRLQDLHLVCANCHRMLHRGGEQVTVDLLRSRIQEGGKR